VLLPVKIGQFERVREVSFYMDASLLSSAFGFFAVSYWSHNGWVMVGALSVALVVILVVAFGRRLISAIVDAYILRQLRKGNAQQILALGEKAAGSFEWFERDKPPLLVLPVAVMVLSIAFFFGVLKADMANTFLITDGKAPQAILAIFGDSAVAVGIDKTHHEFTDDLRVFHISDAPETMTWQSIGPLHSEHVVKIGWYSEQEKSRK
jgi:hypothetical protein